MTLQSFKSLIVSVDPKAQHYESARPEENYTVWMELRKLPGFENGLHLDAWEIAVDRYTDVEFDEVAAALESCFAEHPEISYRYTVSYDIGRHRIHHNFALQVM